MKEPHPDSNGMVCWNGTRSTADEIATIKREGYEWNEGLECYCLSHEKTKELAKFNGVEPSPISFHVDEFHRHVCAPYGGDCGLDIFKKQ